MAPGALLGAVGGLPSIEVGHDQFAVPERKAGRLERRGADAMDARQPDHVVVEDGAAFGIVVHGEQIGSAANTFHDDATRLGAESVHVGHGDVVGLEHLQHAVFVFEVIHTMVE